MKPEEENHIFLNKDLYNYKVVWVDPCFHWVSVKTKSLFNFEVQLNCLFLLFNGKSIRCEYVNLYLNCER